MTLLTKTQGVKDIKTGKVKRISSLSKHERFRRLISQCIHNKLKVKYKLAGSWGRPLRFSSAENMNYIQQHQRLFILPIKANRKVALMGKINVKECVSPLNR